MISEVPQTAAGVAATSTFGATFQIYSAKFYVPIVTLSINCNIKQEFKSTVYWDKYRSEITTI